MQRKPADWAKGSELGDISKTGCVANSGSLLSWPGAKARTAFCSLFSCFLRLFSIRWPYQIEGRNFLLAITDKKNHPIVDAAMPGKRRAVHDGELAEPQPGS